MVENPELERKVRAIKFCVRDDGTWDDLRQIAATHDLREYETARLLMKLGIRAFREGRGLVCGYERCTRSRCCGGEDTGVRAKLLRFRLME